MSGVSSTSRWLRRSRTISPVEDASATTALTPPNLELSWWWSTLRTSGALASTSGSGPSRLSFAQSRARSTRSAASSGRERRRLSSGIHEYSRGSGVSPERYMTTSLPRASRASFTARSEPRASPSGFSCVVTRNRSCERIASATPSSSAWVVWGVLIEELRYPDAVVDGAIVFEGELGSALHPQLICDPCLEDAVSRGEAVERLRPLPLVAEHADVDP